MRHLVLLVAFCAASSATAQQPSAKPLLRDFIGINGHYHFKPELYGQVSRLARNYHDMHWDVKQPGDPITLPTAVNKVDWKRNVYGPWSKAGFETSLCAQFGQFGAANPEHRAVWANREGWLRDYGKELARYFGPSGREKLCTSIEIDNEPGSKFDNALYRRLFIAMAQGIRAGDPRMKIVTCAVHPGKADEYIKSLDETFAGPDIAPYFDAINLHVYATQPRDKAPHPWARSYPEDPGIDYLKTVDEALAWRDRHARGKEVWVTEFGWDSCTSAAMEKRKDLALKLNWEGVTDEQQAQYLVRSLFCFARRDVARAYLYFYNDDDEASVHAASGITRHFQPKPSFWSLKHLYATLGDYRFVRAVGEIPGEAYVYEFSRGSGHPVWVAWSPTGSGRTKPLRLGSLPGRPQRIERMPLAEGAAERIEWRHVGGGTIQFDLTESPAYIFF